MRKTTALTTLLLFAGFFAFSQDSIFISGQKTIAAKVYEVNRIFVKFLFPGNKSFRRISLSVVDSIKYGDGTTDKTVSNYWQKRNAAREYREHQRLLAREKMRQALINRKRRNSFIDPAPNRFSLGAQAMTTSLFLVKPLSPGADLSAALGMHATYERALVKNRIGIAVSGFRSWNKQAEGFQVAARYFFMNRPEFRIGAGPMFFCSNTYFRTIKKRSWSSYYYTGLDGINKDTTIRTPATSIGGNLNIQVNFGKRFFMSNDLFAGVTNYKKSSSEKALFMCRVGVGVRF
ncbi:hypothetical protein [Niabella drilacis]|uniref:Outer membrane protein beta-barrel domain-containing protein n=1 Tax=Niabella drilacis (strain DSM 25811 / CCM 8410 / CCUG 62505 / LMG 26954 / E90) TaxID=1285928 RepID=A0A1G6KYQ9_NIADE|nr:hypothetical protein [Niabella drilacis]SDC35615.1 hypothetical protein SAMN04487894_102136 [Niabella drilacis]